MFCVSLPARTWLKNPTRPIGRWKHEQMFETIVWSCFCPITVFLLSITKFTLWARKGRGITATSDMRLELTRCRKLWKNSGWTYVCMNQSKTQKLKCTSYDLSDFQISVMCGWIGFSLSEKRAIMLHRTGLATSQLLEDKKHIFGLHFVWMPSEHKYLKYLA